MSEDCEVSAEETKNPIVSIAVQTIGGHYVVSFGYKERKLIFHSINEVTTAIREKIQKGEKNESKEKH